jgi:hypothetical protein
VGGWGGQRLSLIVSEDANMVHTLNRSISNFFMRPYPSNMKTAVDPDGRCYLKSWVLTEKDKIEFRQLR